MLEIKNVNKYFNRHKKNELHVINNTSLTINKNGLISLLGPSGCGKTTLLNTIGGLDKVKSGQIYINGKKINSRLSSKVDKIRNLNIGYIFQDYKLIDNLSVYDNVAIVLKMIGLKDKKEINSRVEYVLDKVGMLRYKKRPASMLSGGEKQRVGIARAIVKDPSIILADEPTGNLDSKNSLEVMNIIKAISRDKLVLLVTHEENLANFYSDRIIRIQDGKIISDNINDHENELDYRMDNRFYLKDFKNHTLINNELEKIKIYKNDDNKLDIQIVIDNGNIYIKSNTNDRIEIVDENSNIDFVNDHYKSIQKQDMNKYKFDFKEINRKKYSSIFNLKNMIISGFKKVFDYSILKKFLLAGFFLAGIFIMYSFSSIIAATTIKDEDFVKINKDYLTVTLNKINVNDYLNYEKLEDIEYILPGDSIVNFNVSYDDYYQTSTMTDVLTGSLSDISIIDNKDLIFGKMPNNNHEIVIDKMVIDNMFENNYSQMAGVLKIEDMIDRKITINNLEEFIITGITDKKSPNIYTELSLFINIIANSSNVNNYGKLEENIIDNPILDYNLLSNNIELKKGKIPDNDYEVIVNIDNKETMPLNKEIDTKINGQKLKVVGYYYSKYNYNYYLVNNNTIKYNIINIKNNLTIYTNNKDKIIEYFNKKNLKIEDSYDKSRKEYIDRKKKYIKNSLLVSGIILLISLIEIFLMIRSSFLSRVKEIGIYRAIGIKKSDIYKMFASEIVAITTLVSIPGILLMAYILKVLSDIKYLNSLFIINIPIIIITILFIYIFNLLVGLIPVFNTIRKSPAQILARKDVD